jgi:hypothetical protein
LYPLILENTTDRSGFSKSRGQRTSYWNLLFYNTETNDQHLLTEDKKIVIFSIDINESSSSKSCMRSNGFDVYKDNIFYEVVSQDYNQNGYLDDNDPTYLFISDKQGNNFRRLSPDNVSVQVLKAATVNPAKSLMTD